VVFVIGTLGRGGAESQAIMLMRAVQERGWRPLLFVLEGTGDLRREVDEAGIPIVEGGYDSRASRVSKVLLLVRAGWRLLRLLRKERPQVVHGILPLTNLFAAVAGRFAAVPMVITSRRALNTHQDRVPGWRYADMLSTRLSHLVIANARAVKDDTLKREGGDPQKILIIHNGIDFSRLQVPPHTREQVRKELHVPKNSRVLIIVANLISYKGHLDLLRTLSRLYPEFPDLRLLVVGEDRGIGGYLKSEAERLGVGKLVHWLGLRRDVPQLLAASDIYVSASHEEGFSNSLLEALAAGKAVVATRVGGNPEMLEEGRIGLLVEPSDAAALAHAIKQLLEDADLRAALGSRAAARVAEVYSPDRMVERYLEVYGMTVTKR